VASLVGNDSVDTVLKPVWDDKGSSDYQGCGKNCDRGEMHVDGGKGAIEDLSCRSERENGGPTMYGAYLGG
jgi:hypothetical protein